MPSARVWLFQRSGLLEQKQNTLEDSSKKRIVDALDHGRQTGEEYLVSHTVKNLELEQSTAINVRQWYSPSKLLATY